LRRLRSARRRFSFACSLLETKCIFSRKVFVIRSETTPLLKRRISCSTVSPSRRSTRIALLIDSTTRGVAPVHAGCGAASEPAPYAVDRSAHPLYGGFAGAPARSARCSALRGSIAQPAFGCKIHATGPPCGTGLAKMSECGILSMFANVTCCETRDRTPTVPWSLGRTSSREGSVTLWAGARQLDIVLLPAVRVVLSGNWRKRRNARPRPSDTAPRAEESH